MSWRKAIAEGRVKKQAEKAELKRRLYDARQKDRELPLVDLARRFGLGRTTAETYLREEEILRARPPSPPAGQAA